MEFHDFVRLLDIWPFPPGAPWLPRGKSADDRNKDYANLVDSYYDLATEFYEWGWGTSFHFADKRPRRGGPTHRCQESTSQVSTCSGSDLPLDIQDAHQ